jgi:hypothetical protein
MKTFKEKGPRILFSQILFLDYPLRVFLGGPPNHTFTPKIKRTYERAQIFQDVWTIRLPWAQLVLIEKGEAYHGC